MSTIKIRKNHSIGIDDVRNRVDEVANSLKDKLSADWRWSDDKTLNFARSGASGKLTIADDHLDVEIKLGMLYSPLKKTIEKVLNEELDKNLA